MKLLPILFEALREIFAAAALATGEAVRAACCYGNSRWQTLPDTLAFPTECAPVAAFGTFVSCA